MRTDLCVRAVHKGDMRVDVHVREHVLPMDYPAEPGRDPTPLEVLLASLAACAANTLNLVLSRKMQAAIDSLEVEARAQRRADHPTVLAEIELVYRIGGETLRFEDDRPGRADRRGSALPGTEYAAAGNEHSVFLGGGSSLNAWLRLRGPGPDGSCSA